MASGRLTRRELLTIGGGAVVGASLGSNLPGRSWAQSPSPAGEHFPARAKRLIHIHMVGGTSQVDLFDEKPELNRRDGELCPDELFEPEKLAFIRERPRLLGSPYSFAPGGQSGIELSELLPHTREVVDELTFIRSMQTDEFNHGPAQILSLTGFPRFGRPSLGAWLSYGLGSENRDLPAFVVMSTGSTLGAGRAAWGSGFLPTIHQGVELRLGPKAVHYAEDPPGIDRTARRSMLDAVRQMNELHYRETGDPEIQTRIGQYEMAFRMQSAVPEAMDLENEPASVIEAYGAKPGRPRFANACLLARRLTERGVRVVQLFDSDWDHHNGIYGKLPRQVENVDRPVAALIRDLKERGLLSETLVVFTSEFGRTPMAQGVNADGKASVVGRDHHRDAYTIWLAGGGTRAGHVHGATDEFGYGVVSDPVHLHDLNATILHLMGIDHLRLTYRYQGRDFRLTDVHGKVVREVIA